MRSYVPGEDMSNISVSPEDAANGSPCSLDMIARNPKNHNDQWLVAAQYFVDNLEPAEKLTEDAVEAEIQAKGLNAPRLTPQDINDTIIYAEYYRVDNTTCTMCSLVLKNGYVVVGKSAAASMENFDEDLGKSIAYEDAREQIWALEGYALKQKLYEAKQL